jgi:hypothetical protein
MADDVIFASRIFLNSVLPLVKVMVEAKPALAKGFAGRRGIVQVSALLGKRAEAGGPAKVGTHFVVENGAMTVVKGLAESSTVELEFPSLDALNGFFSGKSKKLPRIKGLLKAPGLLVATFRALLAMASALGAAEPPAKSAERELLVKLYFYLLSSGISQLNKAGHPAVSKWAASSPDRVYAWAVRGKEELSAYLRVKAGNTRSAHGVYERSQPFFTLCFDSPESALGTLLGKDDMIGATSSGKLIMLGAPEFGAMLGEFMLLVGSYAK